MCTYGINVLHCQFSKKSSLLTVVYTMTTQPTFENVCSKSIGIQIYMCHELIIYMCYELTS